MTMDSFRDALARAALNPADLHPLYAEKPDNVVVFTLPGADAVEAWQTLSRIAPETGVWPLLSGHPKDEEIFAEQLELCEDDPQDIISSAEELDLAAWQESRREDGVVAAPATGWPFLASRKHGPSFVTHLGLQTQRPLGVANMLLVAAKDHWHVPAVLGFGGWNDCPSPDVHCAFARLWNREHGAVLAGATYDTLEFHIARPLETKEACIEMARTHYLYCTDIGSKLGTYAASLLGNESWSFWWD
jgi:uncharacterized protein DUF4253